MLSDPTSPTNAPPSYFLWTDSFFLYFYTTEMCLKIISLGFVFTKNSYLRDGWNVLDFIIVTSALLPVVLGGGGASFSLNGLRVLRVLRPLRTISTIRSLKIIL
jgi:hypothetical protein